MYAIKTPDGLGIYRVVNEPLPGGSSDYSSFDVWPAQEIFPQYDAQTHTLVAGDWALVDGVATRTHEAVEIPVPQMVSIAQIRAALLINGIVPGEKSWDPETGSVLDLIQQHVPDPLPRALAMDKLLFANTVERSHPLVPMLAALLGKDDAWTDSLFRLADTL